MPQHECCQLPEHAHPRTEWTWRINTPVPLSFRQITLTYGSPTGSLSPPAKLNPHHPQHDNTLQADNTALVRCLLFPASLPHSPAGVGCEHLSNKGFPGSSDGKSACNSGDLGSIPGLGRFSGEGNGRCCYCEVEGEGEGNGYPLQYSCLENSVDRGAWQATVYGASKSRT